MKNLRGAAAIAFVAAIAASSARADDRVVLETTKAALQSDCVSLRSLGIDCKFVPARDMTGPDGTKNRWVPVSALDLPPQMHLPNEKLTWLERMSGLPMYGQILLFEQSDAAGNTYFVGHPAVVIRVGADNPAQLSSHQDDLWDVASQALPTASVNSDEASRFLTRMDEEVDAAAARAAQEAAAKAAAAEAAEKAAAADRAYLNSPAYKRQQLSAAATNCRSTIRNAQAAIDHDRRVAAVSGYENKLVREQAAEAIINCEDIIRSSQAAR